MAYRIRKFFLLWEKSPKMAIAFMFRRMSRHARRLLPHDEWNKNWLGEEMRPFNSLR